MPEPIRSDTWSGGMNNLDQVDRLPEGQVRDLLNFDPVGGGGLHKRAGRNRVAEISGVHGAVPYLAGLLIAAGGDLLRYDAVTNEARRIGSAPAAGGMCGAELNGDAFLCTAIGSMRVRGDRVGEWGLAEIYPRITIGPGSLPAGIYRVAVTALDSFGAESGAAPLIVTLSEPGTIDLLWSAPAGAVECRVYASATDGETLYLQGKASAGFSLASVGDEGARLITANLVMPPVATQVYAYKDRLLLVAGSALWVTEPYAQHLVNPAYGFIQYGSAVDMVAVTDGGVFVAAGQKTYFLRNPGAEDSALPAVLEHGAVSGSGITLPDGRAAWMTRYGQAIGSADGSVSLLQANKFAPRIAQDAAVGLVESNGVQMLVTTMKGATGPNALGVEDSFGLEIE